MRNPLVLLLLALLPSITFADALLGAVPIELEYDSPSHLYGANLLRDHDQLATSPSVEQCAHIAMGDIAKARAQHLIPHGHQVGFACVPIMPAPATATVRELPGVAPTAIIWLGVAFSYTPIGLLQNVVILGVARDYKSCVSTGNDTISSSIADGDIEKTTKLAISCVAVPQMPSNTSML